MSLWIQNLVPEDGGFVQSLQANRGEVYGVVLNDNTSLKQLGDALTQTPYKALPQAPAMYIKPRNTIVNSGAVVDLPAEGTAVEVGAVLGVVIAKAASRITEVTAADYIAGYVAVADLSLPHDSYYRPAVREKCFDGACPMGELVVASHVVNVAELEIKTFVNDALVATRSLSDLKRSIAQLLCDVSEFMTLKPGDVLLTGVAYQAPQAALGDKVRVVIDQVGEIAFSVGESA